jgi:N,N'-diacetylchitobiose transport system permease protein
MSRQQLLAFIAPSMVTLVVFTVIPLVVSVALSFQSFGYWTLNERAFVGLENYTYILTDARFWQSVGFTFLVMAVVTPTEMVIGFVIALLLDQVSRQHRGIFIAFALTTYVGVPVVASYMFRGMFYAGGVGSWAIELILGRRLILDELSVKLLIIVYQIWRDTPFVILVVFAGLQSLSQELLDAAAIDGAGRLTQLRYITIPHLSPLLILIAIIVVGALYNLFDPVFVITGMNPIFRADTIMTYNWRTATQLNQLGRANAMALLAAIGVMAVRLPFLIQTWRSQIEEG